MLIEFFKWFFIIAPREILVMGKNFLLWGWNFFSIGFFVPRLLSPWHKDLSSYGRGFDLQRFLHIWGWNLISRIIGGIMRLVVIGVGILAEILIMLIFGFVFVIWYLLPVLIPGLFLAGFLSLS